MWFYVSRILVPYQRADAAAHERPRGNLSDLYPRWLGARELVLHGRNPYSREITREIQVGYYGRELDANRPGDPKDQQGFAYPVYVAFLLAPTIGFPFALVSIVFQWFLVIVTAASVPLWFRAIGWRARPILQVSVIMLALGSFPVLQALKLQQLTLIVATLISIAMALLVSGHLFSAGDIVGSRFHQAAIGRTYYGIPITVGGERLASATTFRVGSRPHVRVLVRRRGDSAAGMVRQISIGCARLSKLRGRHVDAGCIAHDVVGADSDRDSRLRVWLSSVGGCARSRPDRGCSRC